MEVEYRIAPLEEVTSSHVISAMTGKKKRIFSAVKMLTCLYFNIRSKTVTGNDEAPLLHFWAI